MSGWIADNIIALVVVAAGVIGAWFAFGGRLTQIEALLKKHEKYHSEHYASIRAIETAAAAIGQRFIDHMENDERHDAHITAQFERIDKNMEGLHADIKDILKHLRNNGK